MAHVLVPVDAYAANVTVPDDGDAKSAASVEVPFQALTDRVHHARTRLVESVGGVLPIPLVASANIGARFTAWYSAGIPLTPWWQSSVADAGNLVIPIANRIGCQMTQIELRCTGLLTAGAHAGNVGTMPAISLYSVDSAAGGASALVATQIDPTTVAGGTYEVMHSITLAGLASTFNATTTFFLTITGEAGANAAADKFGIYSAKLTLAAV